jgi:exodeoxyribonuclease V alpha subunit
MAESRQEVSGTIERLLFSNQENGFLIFALMLKKEQSIVVKGYFPSLQPGQDVRLIGSWVMHPKFGRQFEASECSVELPTSLFGLKKYLGSGLIKGVGKVYAERLVAHFGTEVLSIIDEQPHRLNEVTGIGEKRIDQIKTAWKDQKEISSLMVFLQDKGVPPSFATKIYKKYGQTAHAVLQENPYRLAEDIWGVGFKTADQIAQKMGFERHSIQRIKAGIVHLISSIANQGHLYIILEELKERSSELLEINQTEQSEKISAALHDLHTNEKIKLITYEGKHYITLSSFYFSEKGVATKFKNLLAHPSAYQFDIHAHYQRLRVPDDARQIILNEQQQRGVLACLQNKVTVITGGPGTGKTTLIKTLLSLLEKEHVRYKLAAPTGRAAKRMMEGTGRHAVTLHRLLDFDPSYMGFKHNEQNALALDILIIDEASMIDIFLAHALLKAIPLQAQIIFLGDIDQLPSVGAGNMLNDIIASNQIPVIRLTEIFRQAQNSLIIVNAHRINKGEFPITSSDSTKKDFFFIKEEKPESVMNHIKAIFTDSLPKLHILPSNLAVLVPMNRGIVGTYKINQDLQLFLNGESSQQQIMYGSTLYKRGDRVMQIKNNYDKSVFNGDVGYIEAIEIEDRTISVLFDQRTVVYEAHEFDELVLAYALSIHKSQGSEYDAVIVPLFMQHFMLLQRNLVYTAITRAKKLCIFIGQTKAIAMAIKNNKSIIRTTFLKQFLTTDLTCR